MNQINEPEEEYTGPTCMDYVRNGDAYALTLNIDIGRNDTLIAQNIILVDASDEVIDKAFDDLKQAFKDSR